MAISDFLHRLLKFINQLRMESAFQDSTELLNLENPLMTDVPNPLRPEAHSPESSEMPPIKTKPLMLLSRRVMEFFRCHAGMARPPYPWR